MDTKIKGLVTLIDQAIELARERLRGVRAGHDDASSVEGLEEILSALQYRRGEALDTGFQVKGTESLGLARAALEYDVPDSALIRKIGEVERYFTQNFGRRLTT